MKLLFKLLLVLFLLMGNSCEKEPEENGTCPPFDNIQESPYKHPIWHPTNKIIGFNHTPLKTINYSYGIDCPQQAIYIYEEDSTGFWLIDEDGTNKRRILPYELNTPAWSPDGKWIAFSRDAQIFIMPFDGIEFDISAIVQLTFEGRNFFPAWSPDGEWIVYDSNRDSPTGLHFIWKMRKNGEEKTRIAFTPNQGETRMPFWGKDSTIVHQRYIDRVAPEILTMDLSGNNIKRLTENENWESIPKYAPDNHLLGYISQSKQLGDEELWIMNMVSNKVSQITFEGCQGFSWSTSGKIVYVNYDYSRLDEEKGTLWIMNPDGTEKQQLTHNNFRIIQ